MIHVYTGNGKGKTTAAMGLALRAAGHGFNVIIIQFMKEGAEPSGEISAFKRFENVQFRQFGESFIKKPQPSRDKVAARIAEGINFFKQKLAELKDGIIVLDEINVVLSMKLFNLDDFLNIIDGKTADVGLVLTGRNAPPELIDKADVVTEMRKIKHHFDIGEQAHKGYEY